jgi:hypothetical protein
MNEPNDYDYTDEDTAYIDYLFAKLIERVEQTIDELRAEIRSILDECRR